MKTVIAIFAIIVIILLAYSANFMVYAENYLQ